MLNQDERQTDRTREQSEREGKKKGEKNSEAIDEQLTRAERSKRKPEKDGAQNACATEN